jgi:alkanesulfonate monooxygenase SsuD/methylene tetrahydromethanopterin reductase-like flavin-dependent oxidoreductase (luciferase family)
MGETAAVKLSLWPSTSQGWNELLDVAVHADGAGWHCLYIEDHFMGDGGAFGPETDPRLEATSVLAALAPATERIRLASLVLSATHRHPAVIANWAATMDHLSTGRFTLGLGAGWQQNEHADYGIGLGSPGQRLARLDEYCAVVRSLLSGGRSTFAGEWFALSDALCEPGPIQDPLPILVGGKGDRMLGVVAEHADVWNMWAMPDLFSSTSGKLDRACELIDRDPQTIARSTQALVLLTADRQLAREFIETHDPRAAFAGTAGQFLDLVGEWERVGVDEVIVPDWHLGRGAQRLERLEELQQAFLQR